MYMKVKLREDHAPEGAKNRLCVVSRAGAKNRYEIETRVKSDTYWDLIATFKTIDAGLAHYLELLK